MQHRPPRTLTSSEREWAARQVAAIIGAGEHDAAPLADFLAGIESAGELQSQLLDMLGESPLALDFAAALFARRFPEPELEPKIEPKIEPKQVLRQVQKQLQKQAQRPTQKTPQLPKKERPPVRARCECQASEHPLLTNCLTCGRIVCGREGPGPCMFCGTDVESPDQQLQQHMQRQLHRAAAPTGRLYSGKAGAGPPPREPEPLWPMAGSAAAPSAELSDNEYLQAAFKTLRIDSTDPTSVREAEAWVQAMRRKEKLLGFDRTAAQRSTLIDQAADFDPHAVGRWLSPAEKAELERRNAARLKQDDARDQRRRQGMRVLRLNFASGSVDMSRADDADADADTAEDPAPVPSPAPPRPEVAPGGAFARNPLLGAAPEPRFVLAPDKLASPAPPAERESLPAKRLAQRRLMLRIQSDDLPPA
ncbi:hypothetical protein H4R26_004959 [Coemansia thaxteri]|uniref:TRIP4/RQT4 C2HC5-type zinc finger domain-containing protein n=1 Tax=Coemansia thaxteri TaxID=2663907 RepID=A0A9W8EGA0_9FUNG|nr:hypothetical protein H4R26_004959 [Coemansia thaxteri]KAJ2480240.1 hypothetical protein EV174_003779 [Coemansia sp. RSA 2320]